MRTFSVTVLLAFPDVYDGTPSDIDEMMRERLGSRPLRPSMDLFFIDGRTAFAEADIDGVQVVETTQTKGSEK